MRALDNYLEWLRARAASIQGLRGFFLSGGYGRGEGGLFQPSSGENATLYNDLEFYVFATSVAPAEVSNWVHEGEQRFGIEVEFKILPPEALEKAVPSMFFYDLLQAHEFVAGDPSWLAKLPPELADAKRIPLVEGSRLLVNRGMSLLRCMRWARGERELAPDFCARIAAKAKLAMADAVLVGMGQYHWSCLCRHERLANIAEPPPNWQRFVGWHAEAVEFKFHPSIPERSASDWLGPLMEIIPGWCDVFLWLEGRRRRRPYADAIDYATSRERIFPEESRKKNLLRQLRDLRHSPRVPFQWGDHPRAAIWRALVLMLAASVSPDSRESDSLRAKACSILGLPASTPAISAEETLRACWKRYP